jgi:hypothetical protein
MSRACHGFIIDMGQLVAQLPMVAKDFAHAPADTRWQHALALCRGIGTHMAPVELAGFKLSFLDAVPEIGWILYRRPREMREHLGPPGDILVGFVGRDDLASTIEWFDRGAPPASCDCDAAFVQELRTMTEGGHRMLAVRRVAEVYAVPLAKAMAYVSAPWPWERHAEHELNAQRFTRKEPPTKDILPALAEFRSWMVEAQRRRLDLLVTA